MQVVPLSAEAYGKFYNGDAYIIYSSSEFGQPGGISVNKRKSSSARRTDSMNLEQHIHYWIGEKCSQDEATVAAYKSVELDDLLGGHPIQHREVEGYESARFKSYFKVLIFTKNILYIAPFPMKIQQSYVLINCSILNEIIV